MTKHFVAIEYPLLCCSMHSRQHASLMSEELRI